VRDRVASITEEQACIGRLLARIRQADLGQATQSHFARLAIEHEAKRPALRSSTADAKIKAGAIRIETLLARARDGHCC